MIGRFETLLEAQLQPNKQRSPPAQLWVRLANNFYTPMLGYGNEATPEQALALVASPDVRNDMVVFANHDQAAGVHEACTALHRELGSFAASIGEYAKASEARTMEIPELDTSLSEAQVREYLLEEQIYLAPPTANWRTLHAFYQQLSTVLALVEPLQEAVNSALKSSHPDLGPSFHAAMDVLEAIRNTAIRVDGPKARAVAGALDIIALRQRLQEGTLDTKAIDNACLTVLVQLDPEGIRTADFRCYASHPVALLPRALHETYTAALVSMHLAWHERDAAVRLATATSHAPGKTLRDRAIAFEKANFDAYRKQRHNCLPLTEDWLSSCPFQSLLIVRECHAQAIAKFIVEDALKDSSPYPEVLRPSFDHYSGHRSPRAGARHRRRGGSHLHVLSAATRHSIDGQRSRNVVDKPDAG